MIRCGPIGIVIAAAHVEEVSAVGSETKLGNLLAIVLGVVGQLPGFVSGRASYLNIAHAIQISDPGDDVALFSGRQLIVERVLQHRSDA